MRELNLHHAPFPMMAALACVCLAGCGSASRRSDRTPSARSSTDGSTAGRFAATEHRYDGDQDDDSLGMGRYDTDGDALSTFGAASSAADRQAMSALLLRYYAAAAAGDAARACSLTYWLAVENILEEHRPGKGPPSLRGSTCTQILSKVFAQRHAELAREIGVLRVTVTQVRHQQGWAILSFGPARERVVLMHRDRGGWKMSVLLDNGAL